ncbi:uncharacterized protein LTR77_000379 [Saxophila tyrrhenica]|uniref:RRM domain-containing protein n=1 Tax=Saxophila tyrrhenica TaxID=1690608 RepID=A0AAV9PR02_9PEZI|nr:hypothetical protein LTR77_000379 [Saxophila tyrrhenica]
MQNHRGSNGNGFGHRPNKNNKVPPSPTPGPRRSHGNNNNNMEKATEQGRYVPPQKRAGGKQLPDIVRPESSMSNATFMSQAPPQHFAPVHHNLPNRGQMAHPSYGYLPPCGNYAYGPDDLTEQMARFDASLGSAAAHPDAQRYLGNGRGMGNGRLMGNNVGTGTGLSFRNGGVRPGFGNAPGAVGGGVPSNKRGHAYRLSDADSALGDSQGYRMAQMIMSGAADDPRDPDFGNPGPSRRPEAAQQALIAAQQKHHRGDLAAAAGEDVSPYTSVHCPNIRGNPAAYLGTKQLHLPLWMNDVDHNGGRPTVAQVFADLPLIEACRVARPSTAGVICIRSIPYTTTRAEITAFLGRNSQIVNQPIGTPFTAIHIMMERMSGKTQDAFIEVESPKEAGLIHGSFIQRIRQGRMTKLGDRPVIVELSSQQELMSEMFNRAKTVTWVGNQPKFDNSTKYFYDGVESVGFEGFLRDEDYAHLLKHIESPQRSPFVQRCIIRPYESLISTIHKFPWFDVEHVLLSERDQLFKVTITAIDTLMALLRKHGGTGGHDATKPNNQILKEVAIAALTCPGFSEFQKSRVIRHLQQGNYGQYTVSKGLNLTFGGIDNYSPNWPFLILVKKPGVNDELIEYIAGLMRDTTTGSQMSLADIHSMQASGNLASPFGHLDIQYEDCKTLADVGRLELRTIEKILCFSLPRGRPDRTFSTGRSLGTGLYMNMQ